MRYIGLSVLCLASFATQAAEPTSTHPAVQAQVTTLQSAHDFVQGFYEWYVQKAQQQAQGWPVNDALQNKRWPLSEQIVSALKADRAAQDKVPDEIVGIDFDPFLAAQDTCFPYKTGKVTQAGTRYRVEVFDSNCTSPHPELATVIAEVEQRHGTWMFVNFIYPDTKDDLLSVLKGLKEEREKHPN